MNKLEIPGLVPVDYESGCDGLKSNFIRVNFII